MTLTERLKMLYDNHLLNQGNYANGNISNKQFLIRRSDLLRRITEIKKEKRVAKKCQK